MIVKRCDICGKHGANENLAIGHEWHDMCEECLHAVKQLLIERGAIDSYEFALHKGKKNDI